jgi:DNA-binding HxlR family transcriptional regulator
MEIREDGLIGYTILCALNTKTSTSEEELIIALAEKGLVDYQLTKAVLQRLMGEKLVRMDSHLFAEPPYNASYTLTPAGRSLASRIAKIKNLSRQIIDHTLEDLEKVRDQLSNLKQDLLALKSNLDSD